MGADPNRQDRKGRSPGHCGCAKGQFETVKLLNSRGANLWLRNARGDLPVHEAAASGRIELVEWLLQQKPNHINSSSNDGRTILHIAAGNDNIDMCKILIQMGSDVNAVYRNIKNVVKTPLDCALQKGFRSTAKFIQMHEGLPANKLRLSGRKTHAILPELDEVKPLQFTEVEVTYEQKSRRHGSESESEIEGSRRRKKHRKCSHRRRTSSCSDTYICHRANEPCEIGRSKSSTELHRRRKSKQYSISSSSNSENSQSESSDEECCYHVKRKHRCYKKAKSKSKERDGSKKRRVSESRKGSESEGKENGDKDHRGKKDKKKVEIASSAKKNDSKTSSSIKAKTDQKTTKAPMSASKKRPPSAKPPIQKKFSQEERQKSLDTPKTPEIQEETSPIEVAKKSPTTTEEVSEDDKTIKEITTQAEVHENLQTDVDEGALTDATYTVEKREKSDIESEKEKIESVVNMQVAPPTVDGAKKVSFKSVEEKEDEKTLPKTPEPPVEVQQPPPPQPTVDIEKPTAIEKISSSVQLVPEKYDEEEYELPENIPRPKSQTPESVGSFTVLEDGDDADQKLREFEEMTQDEAFLNMDDDESEHQYFDDSSSLEKLPKRGKKREMFEEEKGFKILDESKDQDSGIEPSPRAQRSKIPGPRSSLPTRQKAFIQTEDRPRSTRIEGRKPGDKNAVNMTTVTQSIQKNMRR